MSAEQGVQEREIGEASPGQFALNLCDALCGDPVAIWVDDL